MSQLLGLPIVFPDYANTAQAIQSYMTFPTLTTGQNATAKYKPTGHYLDVPLAVFVEVTTDGNAGSRSVFLAVDDNLGGLALVIPAAATQAASLTYAYSWLWTVASASALGIYQVMPLTPTILSPGYTLRIDIAGGPVGNTDSFPVATVTMLRIPTSASPNAPDTAPLVPTPLLV